MSTMFTPAARSDTEGGHITGGTMLFRLLTYNIHKGIGGIDRRYRLERIISVIRAHHADIVFLQEVDDGVPRSRLDRQVDVIGEALELKHRAFQRNVNLTRGSYGNAVLSRFPLSAVEHLDLTVPLKKRRRALVANCAITGQPGGSTLLVNCHLGLAGFERAVQVQRLLTHVSATRSHACGSHIIGGDFNDVWRSLGRRFLEPAGYRSVRCKAPTFPAMFPMRALDQVYFRGALVATHSFVGRSQQAHQASDHLPLIADFHLNARPDDRRDTVPSYR